MAIDFKFENLKKETCSTGGGEDASQWKRPMALSAEWVPSEDLIDSCATAHSTIAHPSEPTKLTHKAHRT